MQLLKIIMTRSTFTHDVVRVSLVLSHIGAAIAFEPLNFLDEIALVFVAGDWS